MNYEKTAWKNGDVVTSAKLNNIEDGIGNLYSDVTEISTKVNELNDEVEDLINKPETITIECDVEDEVFKTKGAASIYGKEVELITEDSIDSYVTVPTIILNGNSNTRPNFYAPTTAGTSGYVLKSNGRGAPTWVNAALTDTKNTAGSTNSTSKLYLIGAKSQAANTQTYSNGNLYFNNGLNSETSIVSGWQSSISQDSHNISLEVNGDNNEYYISINYSDGITIEGVVTPTEDSHAANKKYVDDNCGEVLIVRW